MDFSTRPIRPIIVTGGRKYDDYVMVQEVLDFLNPDLIIQGGATGADGLARIWADETGTQVVTLDADWEKHGKVAGPIRNKEMILANPDAIVVAFPGGKGTENCVKTAVGLNRIVLRVEK